MSKKRPKDTGDHYRILSELASDITFIIDVKRDGSLDWSWTSESFGCISNYNFKELKTYDDWLTVIHKEDMPIIARHVRSLLSGEESECEVRIVAKNGDVHWVRTLCRPEFDEEKRGPVRILGAATDITERRRAEEKLGERNKELSMLNEIYRIVTSSRNRNEILKKILEPLSHYAEAEVAVVYDLDFKRREKYLIASVGLSKEDEERISRISLDDEIASKILSSGDVIVTEEDMPGSVSGRQWLKDRLGVKRTVIFLVYAREHVSAMFIIGCCRDEDVSQAKRSLLGMVGNQIGIALERLELLDVLEKREKELKRLTGGLIDSIEGERRQIAMGLHDEIWQSLVVLNVELDLIEDRLSGDDIKSLDSAASIREQLQKITESMRQVSYSLHPSMLEDLGLVSTLNWYIDKFIRSERLAVDMETAGFDERLPEQISLALYRVAQEALTNAVRHSGASRVLLKLIKGYPTIIMKIEDNGRGFLMTGKEGAGPGLGIVGMRERIKHMGGEFQLKSSLGGGTAIRVTLPLEGCDGDET